MHKRAVSFLVSAVLMSSAFAFDVKAEKTQMSTAEEMSGTEMIYEDNFDEGIADWSTLCGKGFTAGNGGMRFYNMLGETFPTVTENTKSMVENGHISFDAKVSNSRDFGVFVRREDDNNSYFVSLDFSRERVRLMKKTNGGSYVSLAVGKGDFSQKEFHRVDIGLKGVLIEIKIDGEEVLSYTCEKITSGKVAFQASKGNIVIDNFVIYEIPGEEYVYSTAEEESVDIYVAPEGNDETGTGSIDAPFATMERAKTAAKALKGQYLPINVIFKEGEYFFDKCITFTADDSGSSYAPIRYKAEEGANVIFSGAKQLDVSAFSPVSNPEIKQRLYEDVADKVYQMDLASQGIKREDIDFVSKYDYSGYNIGTFRTINFFLNDKKQIQSRWPNSGYEKIYNCTRGSVDVKDPYNGGSIVFTNPEPLRWTKAKDMYVEGRAFYEWYNESMFVKNIDIDNMTINMKYNSTYGFRADHEWMAKNLLEEIDIPGEWYVDFDAMMLYYYPQHELGTDDKFEITNMSDSFIVVSGAQYLTFEGIEFEKTKSDFSVYSHQNSMANASGIEIKNTAKHITVKNCKFTDMARSGVISMYKYEQDFTDMDIDIVGCDFIRCEFAGVYCAVTGDSDRLMPGKWKIRNCYFYDAPLWPGVLNSTNGVEVTNNLITHTESAGINFKGSEMKIDNNELSFCSYNEADMGAIYSGRVVAEHGTTVSNNLIHHYGPDKKLSFPVGAIYLDDAAGGITLEGNMSSARSKKLTSTAMIYGGGPDIIYRDNISADAAVAFIFQNRVGIYNSTLNDAIGKRNVYTSPVWLAKYPEVGRFATYMNGNVGLYETNDTITNNLAVNCNEGSRKTNFDLAPVPTGLIDDAFDVGTDTSVFVDYDKLDFRITDEAKAKYNLPDSLPGESFDLDSIGVQRQIVHDPELVKFELTYPKNGEETAYANYINLSWQNSETADEYFYTIASDPEMSNIVVEGKTVDPTVSVQSLEADKTYYWKVKAVNYARKAGYEADNEGGVQSFKTSSRYKCDTELLEYKVKQVKDILSGMREGTLPGEYKAGTYNRYKDKIAEAETMIAVHNSPQPEVDAMAGEIKQLIENEDSYKNTGFSTFTFRKNSKWLMSDEGVKAVYGNAAAEFTPSVRTNISLAEPIPNYEVLCFRAKVSAMNGGSQWVAFTMRQQDAANHCYSDKCYYVLAKPDIFELQRKGAIIATAPNDGKFKIGEWNEIQMGCVSAETGVNIKFTLNGEVIFDYFDDDADTVQFLPGMFSVNVSEGVTLNIEKTDNVPQGLFEFSQNIADIAANGRPIVFGTNSDSFEVVSGKWSETGYIVERDIKELASQEAGASVRCTMNAAGDTVYRVYYYNHPSAENDNNVKVIVTGKDGKYETYIDLTKGDEGYTELGTFKFVSDDASKGITAVVVEGSGNGKVPVSSFMIRKVDKNLYPDLLTQK